MPLRSKARQSAFTLIELPPLLQFMVILSSVLFLFVLQARGALAAWVWK